MALPPLDPPFGAHALSPPRLWLQRRGDSAKTRLRSSIWRRLSLFGLRPPYDVSIFGGSNARLYPGDNRGERRAVCGSQFFDPKERARLDADIRNGSGDYVFLDVGANAGLYTLWVLQTCHEVGRAVTVVAVEPDPITKRRLLGNLAANGATEVIHADVALSDRDEVLRFRSGGLGNRGEAGVDPDGDIELRARPLLDVVADAGLTRIDAMKMDIEGHEAKVLRRFFQDAPEALHPVLIQVETIHDAGDLPPLLTEAGYTLDINHGANATWLKGRKGDDANDRS